MTPHDSAGERPPLPRLAAEVAVAVLAGWLIYKFSALLVAPGAATKGFGIQWQMMSSAPFDWLGQLPHRVLGPLLAHVVGYGGEGWVDFVRGLNVLLLATVFLFCRHRGTQVHNALLVVVAVAVTAPVQMYKEHWVGYTDPLCYTLFLWMMMCAKRPALFWALFLANMFNHELAAFLLPWLWLLRRREDARWRADLVCVAVAMGAYAAFYFYVKANAPDQLFNADFFLQHPLFPGGTVVVWSLAFVHWTLAYGPVLAVLSWHQHSSTGLRERWDLWFVFAGIMLIFCIAFDWARHTNLVVMPFVLASARVLRGSWAATATYGGLIAASLAMFWFKRPWSATAEPTHSLVLPALEHKVVIQVPTGYGFGGLDAALSGWLPAVLPLLSGVFAIFAAIWLAGWGIARWRRPTT